MERNNNIIIIGISGKAESGKDYITQQYLRPLGFVPWSLAWHFKIWLIGKGYATYEECFVTKPPHVRKLLQEEGTERGRNVFGENVWLQTAATWMQLLNDAWGVSKFVIPDIRFKNEVTFVQGMGGKVFRIHAPKRVAKSSLTPEARLHISETALDDYPIDRFDGIILNDPEHSETVKRQLNILLNNEEPLDAQDTGEFEIYSTFGISPELLEKTVNTSEELFRQTTEKFDKMFEKLDQKINGPKKKKK